MNQNQSGKHEQLFRLLGADAGGLDDGQCEHPDCDSQGMRYKYPRMDNQSEPETAIYCLRHVWQGGFCFCCGGFFGGIESFDFGDRGLCDECETDYELNKEIGEY